MRPSRQLLDCQCAQSRTRPEQSANEAIGPSANQSSTRPERGVNTLRLGSSCTLRSRLPPPLIAFISSALASGGSLRAAPGALP